MDLNKIKKAAWALGVVVAVGAAAASSIGSSSSSSGFPTCDSKEATDDLKETLANNADSNTEKVQLLDWSNLAEVSFDEKAGLRECVGDIVLNTGNETVSYTFRRAKSDPSQILVQVQELNYTTAAVWRHMAMDHAKTPEQKAQEAAQAQQQEQERQKAEEDRRAQKAADDAERQEAAQKSDEERAAQRAADDAAAEQGNVQQQPASQGDGNTPSNWNQPAGGQSSSDSN